MSEPAPTPQDSSNAVRRIREHPRNDSYGIDAALDAWRFAQSVRQANELLRRCADRISQGDSTDAFIAYESNRSLVDAVESIDESTREAWDRRCERYGWEKAEPLKASVAHILSEAFSDIESLKPTLLEEYRGRIQRKGPRDGYAIVKLLAKSLPSDTEIQAEYSRVTAELIRALEADLIVACSSSKPTQEALAALRKYRDCGLVFPDTSGPIEDALAEERKANASLVEKEVAALPKQLDAAAESKLFAIQEKAAQAGNPKSLREKLDPVVDALAQRRNRADTAIALRETLDALAASPKDKAIKQRLRGRIDTMREQNVQLPKELLAEVEAAEAMLPKVKSPKPPKSSAPSRPEPTAKSAAKPASGGKSKTPIFIAAGAAAVIAVGVFFAVSGGNGDPSAPTVNAPSPLALALKSLDMAAAGSLDDAGERSFQKALAEARALAQQTPNDLASAKAIEAAAQRRLDIRRAQAVAHANELLDQAAAAVAVAMEIAGQDAFEARLASAEAALGKADAVAASAGEPDNHLKAVADYRLLLANAKSQHRAQYAKIQVLSKADTLQVYFDGLRELAASGMLRDGELELANAVLALDKKAQASLEDLVQFKDLDPTSPLRSGGRRAPASIALEQSERDHLDQLIDQAEFASTYVSVVKHYQASTEPLSVHEAYLAEPVVAATQVAGGRINTEFSVRGYDDDGRPRATPLQATHSRIAKGKEWGFFYEPSTLSPESSYYAETINPALKEIRQGADASAPLKLIGELASQRQLSPLFRIFWIQQVDKLMAFNPDKWPFRSTPSLERARVRIEAYAPTTLNAYRWIAVGPKIPERATLDAFLDDIASSNVAQEAVAFSLIANFARKGHFVVVGHVSSHGESVSRHADARSTDTPWSIDASTGKLVPIATNSSLLPLAPVLAYRVDGIPGQDALAAAAERSGVDLTQQQYASQIPQVLRAQLAQ